MKSIGSDMTNIMKNRNIQQQPAATPSPPAQPIVPSQQKVLKGIKDKRMQQGGKV